MVTACKGHSGEGRAQGRLPHVPHDKETGLPHRAARPQGAAPPQNYLFKDEIFPCWYRSAPPKAKNQQVRKADLRLLGKMLDLGGGFQFCPIQGTD